MYMSNPILILAKFLTSATPHGSEFRSQMMHFVKKALLFVGFEFAPFLTSLITLCSCVLRQGEQIYLL